MPKTGNRRALTGVSGSSKTARASPDIVGAMPHNTSIVCAPEPALDVAEFRRVLVESGLAAIRPVNDLARLRAMLSAADLVLTARIDEPGRPLVGLARCITDFEWCCFVSELAVCPSAQGQGIGKALLDAVRRQLGPKVSVGLFSVPDVMRVIRKSAAAPINLYLKHDTNNRSG
jgi:GNAT superfamily N-acetyltransferase